MDSSIFLGIMWDYFDWIKVDRDEIERKVRLELNEWTEQGLLETRDILQEILKELDLDIKESKA